MYMNLQRLASLGIKQKGEYFETKNYSLFKFLTGNREVKQPHVVRLKFSMSQSHLLTIVVVNERFEIIDGQHRYIAMKDLGLPISFIIKDGYGLKEVMRLNTNSATWTRNEFLQSYCEEGLAPYLEVKRFKDKYPLFAMGSALTILTNSTAAMKGRTVNVNKKRIQTKDFEEGKLVIPNVKKAYENAEAIMQIKPYFSKIADNNFVTCMLHMLEHENYEHKEFLKKLKQYPTDMLPCRTIEQYKLLVEEIYNRGRKVKVNLRY